MPKTFYTERDIKDLLDRGVTALEVSDDVVLTDLARDMALRHGLRLLRANPAHPEDAKDAEIIHRVKAAVIARLGDQVDAKLLDAVVAKVVAGAK
ncbi:MAG TPA: hypothetical protein VI793_03310 [Anaerolineales bacterium]|nr:hypothetical protein [Anaerolineales bacterium]